MDSEPRDEESLWRDRASEGDPIALGHIYDTYAQRIYRYLYRRSGDAALAEDLTADVFLRLVEAPADARVSVRDRWRPGSIGWRTTGWSTTSGGGASCRWPTTTTMPSEDGEPAGIHRGELRAALRQLTPDQQQVVALKFLEGLTNTQIAEALAKPEGAVKSLQHRALDALSRHP